MRYFLAFFMGSLALGAQTIGAGRVVPKTVQTESKAAAPSRLFSLGPAPRANLGPIDDSIRDKPSPRQGVPRVATHRTVSSTSLSQGQWLTLADGSRVWRVAIQSQNALGIRLHFTNFSVGAGQVWVHDAATPAKQTFGPYTATGRDDKGDFWTPAVFADTAEVEYKPAAGAATSGLPPFTIEELIHMWQIGPYQAPRSSTGSSAAAVESSKLTPAANVQVAAAVNYSCFLDATCYQNDPVVYNGSHATAMIFFSDYQCSATILNAPNQVPMILTAGHCLNNQTDASGTEVLYDFRTAQCGQDANLAISQQYLNSLPYSLGTNLLAFANSPFIDGTVASQIKGDLDYSLIQLDSFPLASDVILSGYTTTEIAVGDPATSLSHPLGEYMKVSFGTRLNATTQDGSYFLNAYEIDQSGNGRVDSGASGSGIFDKNGYLVGLLSTAVSCANPLPNGNCPANTTACDIPAPFEAWYTKFSVIYPLIEPFLDQPLGGPGSASNPDLFRATPNPVYVTDGSGFGQTTLYINDPAAAEVQIRVGSVNGPLLYDGSGVGQSTTGKWVTDGLIFYLQDVSNGKLLTSSNTIATVTTSFGALSVVASPASIPEGTLGQTTVTWNAVNTTDGVNIYVGNTSGPIQLFAAGGVTGVATTGEWATAGTTFYLEDAGTNAILASTTVQGSSALETQFTATPNPIIIPGGGPALGQTTLNWTVPQPGTAVEVHVGSPAGPLMAASGSIGSATTGLWVINGLTFYLQNVTGGLPLTAANTLATTTVFLTPE